MKDIKDHFVIAIGRTLYLIKWSVDDPDNHSVKPSEFITVDEDVPSNMMNDGKCDSHGRLWAGKAIFKERGVVELEILYNDMCWVLDM